MNADRPRVRRIRADETDVLRRVRLAALADAPEAFSSEHETEQQLPHSTWEQRCVDGAESDHLVTVVAMVGADACGIAVGRLLDDAPGVVELNSMWVTRPQRGTGVAVALTDSVVGWAQSIDAVAVELWVIRENEQAATFYARCGFTEMAGFASQPDDPCRLERRLRLDLD